MPCEYPHVPTPKELELSRQVVQLQQEKDSLEAKLISQIKDLESQIHKLQVRLHDLTQQLQSTKREQTQLQQTAVEQERLKWKTIVEDLEDELLNEKNDKEAQRLWLVRFMPTPKPLDASEEVFARFAQSVALLPAYMAVKVTKAGVLPFLAHLLRENLSDVVTGSVLLALVHLSIYQKPVKLPHHPLVAVTALEDVPPLATAPVNIKEEVVKAGAAAPLVQVLEHCTNQRVLSEAGRLCAALSSMVTNKRALAAKHAVRYLLRLLLPSQPRADVSSEDEPIDSARMERLPIPGQPLVQKNVLSALVNLCHDSEILRSQIANFNFIPIAVRYLKDSTDLDVKTEAAKLIGNLAFAHVVNQSAVMAAEGHLYLTRCLTAEYLHRSPHLVRACAIAIGNLAFTSVSQLTIGYGDTTTLLLQILVDSTTPGVLEAAANAVASLCHGNQLNKNRVAAQNGLQVLLYVIGKSSRYQNDEDVLVAACNCFAVVVRTRSSRSQVFELDGHLPVVHLCKKTTSPLLLEASAMAVSALVPTPTERKSIVADEKELKLEVNKCGLGALERARHLLFGSYDKPVPSWLSHSILGLQLALPSTEEERSAPGGEEDDGASEFHEHRYYSMETLTDTPPDELCPMFYESEAAIIAAKETARKTAHQASPHQPLLVPKKTARKMLEQLVEDLQTKPSMCNAKDYPGVSVSQLNEYIFTRGPLWNPLFGKQEGFFVDEGRFAPFRDAVEKAEVLCLALASSLAMWAKVGDRGGRVGLPDKYFISNTSIRAPAITYTTRAVRRVNAWTYDGGTTPCAPVFVVEFARLSSPHSELDALDRKDEYHTNTGTFSTRKQMYRYLLTEACVCMNLHGEILMGAQFSTFAAK
ncbi:TPA: hypothetical protein N0F65_000195 [Lagenidium giganteum]|uniref:Vacuolar protein 8 n=1 Tax=Lagenidium giganteum TaxID=4803 RepID=A0AAV2YE05_9STRA|nr:TPA: hypothetical protein N0F65_000195 [Lagenidium giganteum]